jgi:hypothetical protein
VSRNNFIALMGKLRSGKDTAGQILVDIGGGARVAFADKLKQICGEMYGLTHDQMNTDAGKEAPTALRCMTCPLCHGINCREVKLERETKVECLNRDCNAVGEIASFRGFWTPRMILQHVGTEGLRRVDANVWVRHAINQAKSILEQKYQAGSNEPTKALPRIPFVVFTDCRFRSEMAGIVANGGEVWRIRRPETDVTSSGLQGHASETEMDSIPDGEFNRVVVNDGDLNQLRSRLSAQLTQFLNR